MVYVNLSSRAGKESPSQYSIHRSDRLSLSSYVRVGVCAEYPVFAGYTAMTVRRTDKDSSKFSQ